MQILQFLHSYNFGDFSLYLKSPLHSGIMRSHSYFWMLMAQSIWDELHWVGQKVCVFRNTVENLTTLILQQLRKVGPSSFISTWLRHCPSTICLRQCDDPFQGCHLTEKYGLSHMAALITDLGTNIQSYIFISSVLKYQPSKLIINKMF